MRAFVLMLLSSSSLACGPVEPPDAWLACTTEDDCPPNWSCGPNGEGDLRCLRAASDAGMRDGGTEPVDAPRDDAPPSPCVVAGGTDADGDGVCVPLDCDDGDAAIHPDAAEVCTANDVRTLPVDENCDGDADEGCAWAFGAPHAMVDASADALPQYAPWLSEDGRRIYFTAYDVGMRSLLRVAERSDTSARFGLSRALTLVGAERSITGCAMAPDERVVVCSDSDALYVAMRSGLGAAFGTLTRLDDLSSAGAVASPHITPAGDELFFVRPLTSPAMFVASMDGIEVGPAERVTVDPAPLLGIGSPQLLADGITLLYTDGGELFTARRSEPGSLSFVDGRSLGLMAGQVHVAERTHEVFMSAKREWNIAARDRLFRARVCWDGACPDVPRPICPTGAIRSPDGLHCYFRTTSTATRALSAAACVEDDAHLATVHSPDENQMVADVADGVPAWIGLRADAGPAGEWDTGEPVFFTLWAADNPDLTSGATAVITSAEPYAWDDRANATAFFGVCEASIWPAW